MFNSRKYKDFAGIYEISLTPTIKIVNKDTNNVLKQHDRGFVRLSGNGKCISITVQTVGNYGLSDGEPTIDTRLKITKSIKYPNGLLTIKNVKYE